MVTPSGTSRSHRWTLAVLAGVLLPAALAGQGRIVTDTLHSRAIEGNRLGDTPEREVVVYLPPGYDRSPGRRYPVLYLLHGVTSVPQEWLDGTYEGFDLRRAMDSLAGAGGAEYLVVMPNADNAAGGTFYVNSAAFGGWETFITRELVPFIDRRYRTIEHRKARGLAGQSMGGFGALYLAGRHAALFSHIYAMSPCCLGLVGELVPDDSTWTGRTRASGLVKLMAAAFAPADRLAATRPTGAPEGGLRLTGPVPYAVDPPGNRMEDPAALAAWREFLPLERVARNPAPYRGLCRIMLDAGRQDHLANVPAGTRAFSEALSAAGIRHELVEYDGGHVDRARERFEQGLLPFFARAFGDSAAC